MILLATPIQRLSFPNESTDRNFTVIRSEKNLIATAERADRRDKLIIGRFFRRLLSVP